jgi:predicted transcriptional regulator
MSKRSVEERLALLEKRISDLEQSLRPLRRDETTSRVSPSALTDLLNLPDSMQKTMIAMQELKEGTAADVAEKTGRNRSVETIYLNGLVRMGLVSRERRGHRVYFRPIRYY